MNTVRKILEFILITLIFYALYNLSLSLHAHYFEKEDPALFVLASFLLSFLLILFYRFTLSRVVRRRVHSEVHQVYKTKEEKMRVLAGIGTQKDANSPEKGVGIKKQEKEYDNRETTKE